MLYGLSGTLWPVHIKPLPDELLSSWLIRLAHAHGYKVQTLCLYLFGRDQPVWNRDIDKLVSAHIKDRMCAATGATAPQFDQTSLRSFEGVLSERVNAQGLSRWIVPIGIFHRARERPGLMYCASCLSEDPLPYYRKQWRLAFSTVCTKHSTYLIGSCPFCSAPIAPHRSDMGSTPRMPDGLLLTCCYKCGKKLHRVQETSADSRLVMQQVFFENALSRGYVDWNGNPSMYSVIFFDGMRELISGLMSKSLLTRLRKIDSAASFNHGNQRNTGFESADISVRREIMTTLAYLTSNWPYSFIEFIHRYHLCYSDLRSDVPKVPSWYENLIRCEAYRASMPLNREYIDSIVSATITQFDKFNSTLARRLSGRNIELKRMPLSKKDNSVNLFQSLLTSIDQEIARAEDAQLKLILIRDKVMIALSKACQLGTKAISDFSLAQCRQLASNTEQLDFSSWPITQGQARAWAEWFFYEIRPHFMPSKSEDRLFLSLQTHQPLRKSAVSLRLRRAIKAAGLEIQVVNCAMWKRK